MDPELRKFARHFFHCAEVIDAASLSRVGAPGLTSAPRGTKTDHTLLSSAMLLDPSRKLGKVSDDASASDAWDFYVSWMAGVMWLVTAGADRKSLVFADLQPDSYVFWLESARAGHEQMGAVEVYAQDVSALHQKVHTC